MILMIHWCQTKNGISELVLLSFLLIFFILEYIRDSYPENLYTDDQTQIKTGGLIVIIMVIDNSVLISSFSHRLKPKFSLLKAVFLTGVLLMAIEIIFLFLKQIISEQSLSISVMLHYISFVISLGLMGGAIANNRLHKLNGKKRTIPILIMIVIWVSIVYIVK